MSFPYTEQATYMLFAHSNVYLDVAVVNWCIGQAGFHRLLRQVIDTVGPDKILFGSDQMNMPQMIPVGVSAIREAPFLSEEEKRKILGDNARKLLGINIMQRAWSRKLPNHRMESDWGAIRPPKGILAPKIVASPEVGSGLVPHF